MKIIALTRGYSTIIDDEDYAELQKYKWYACVNDGRVYAQRDIGGRYARKTIKMHRLLISAPSGVYVDHKNGNTLDNQKSNLRLASNQQNQRNSGILHSKSTKTSKFKGVSWDSKRQVWVAQIMKDRKQKQIGTFTNEVFAAQAYDAWAKYLFGEYAKTNLMLGLYEEVRD